MLQLQHARKKFTKFKRQDRTAERKAKLERDPMIERLHERFGRFFDLVEDNQDALKAIKHSDPHAMREVMTSLASQAIGDIRCSAEEIEKLSLTVPKRSHEEEREGLYSVFIDLLILNGRDKEYTVRCHDWHPFYTGMFNEKKITFNGNPFTAGLAMEGGHLVINGEADHVGEFMRGGLIEARACGLAGDHMKGGRIKIAGDVLLRAGSDMTDGLIEIGGNCQTAGLRMKGGAIEVNGNSRCIGSQMENGIIWVYGNVDTTSGLYGGTLHIGGDINEVAGISSGEVSVLGNCRKLGWGMTGGSVVVYGNVHRIEGMRGGQVHVHGDIDIIEENTRGRIFHKRKLVVDK